VELSGNARVFPRYTWGDTYRDKGIHGKSRATKMTEDLLSFIHGVLEGGESPGVAPAPLLEEERLIAAKVANLAREVQALEEQADRMDRDRDRRRIAYRQLLRGLKAVRRVGRILLETTDVDEICRRCVRIMVEDLGAVNSSILLLSHGKKTLRLVAAYGRGEEHLSDKQREARFNRMLTIKVGEGVAGRVVSTGKPRYLANVEDDPSFAPLRSSIVVKSLYCFPLRGKSANIGVINLSHPNLEDSGTNLRRLLFLLSSSVGQVITIARLHRRLITQEYERHAKLASLGEMAASVAHEINNPVTNILLRAQKLKRANCDADKVKALASDMEKETFRIAKIVTKLLDVGPDEEEEPTLESVNEVVEDTLILTEHHLRSRQSITVNRMFEEGIPEIRVVRRELEQVFTNLITNAARAMPEGGELTIVTRSSESGPDLPPDRYVAVDFIDTGQGILPEYLEKIFQPFFTTGRKGGGAGLGLPISREIVERFGGEITVKSREDEGTCFTVLLPAVGEGDTNLISRTA